MCHYVQAKQLINALTDCPVTEKQKLSQSEKPTPKFQVWYNELIRNEYSTPPIFSQVQLKQLNVVAIFQYNLDVFMSNKWQFYQVLNELFTND